MRFFIIAAAWLLAAFAPPADNTSGNRWSAAQAQVVWLWLKRADDEGITIDPAIARDLRAAIDSGDERRMSLHADTAAMRLMLAFHGQCCSPRMPGNWYISRPVTQEDLATRLAAALAEDQVSLLFRTIRPTHPHYRALAAAHAAETDPARRLVLALNLARWRSIPLPSNGRYIIVNAAAQELAVWEGQLQIDSRRVIVGTPATRTPVFEAEASGVVLNPWWIIPDSIAAEGIAALVRRNPAAARARGYIYSQGRYRQMPGDNNALGRMKLVMPNRFSVFLHDTSNRDLFARDERLLSHGCVRVQGAIDFAELLLGDSGWPRAAIDEVIETGETTTIPLARPVPLFIAYFTAVPDADGGIRILEDVYGRDREAFAYSPKLREFPYAMRGNENLGCESV